MPAGRRDGGGHYAIPVPGRVTQVDQGVDIAPAPGTQVDAIANETLVGVIPNWYKGQPFYWFKETGSNVYNYVAEQFRSKLRVGQSVKAGQEIGTVAPTGTGLELGFATASGQTVARATTGYTEGQTTAAGRSYEKQVIYGGTRPGGQPAGSSSGGSGSASGIFDSWKGLRDTPRTAPPGTKNPFQWWAASFTDSWDNLSAGGGGGAIAPAATPSGGKTYGQISYDQVAAISQRMGWSTQEADVWFNNLIPSESNGTLTDTNSSSGAYGIAQGITGPSWYHAHGGDPNTVVGQLTAMANYIRQRYGTPSAAWSFHKKNNWY